AVAGPVPTRSAGDETIARHPGHALQQRHLRPLDLDVQAGAPRHFERVTRESETGDVGDGVYGRHVGQLDARRVEPRRRVDQAAIAGRVERVLLQRGREHANTDRLAEYEHVAGLRIGVAPDLLRMHEAHDDEA